MCNSCRYGYPERRWLQFLILRVVCEKPSYGYEMIKKIDHINGRHELKSGTIYTTLRRMEQYGLIKSGWKKNEDGPDKRMYKITKKGKTYLKKWLEMVLERREMMDNMAKFYEEYFGGVKNGN